MASMSSFTKQNLLLEFASLKHACPEGIYVTLTPGDPSLWSGVLFVRAGPYAPAVLRFQLSFPSNYPSSPPLVTFSTEIFHPLLTPLTTQTYASSPDGNSAEEERLPPGGFSLRHGFPQWTGVSDPRGVIASPDVPVFKILEYMRSAFNDESVLNSVPLQSAANAGAYHAWHAYKAERDAPAHAHSPSDQRSGSRDTAARPRRPGEWNWQGVWEERVRKNVQASLSEPVLFGTGGSGDEIIRFSDLDPESTRRVLDDISKRTVLAK